VEGEGLKKETIESLLYQQLTNHEIHEEAVSESREGRWRPAGHFHSSTLPLSLHPHPVIYIHYL